MKDKGQVSGPMTKLLTLAEQRSQAIMDTSSACWFGKVENSVPPDDAPKAGGLSHFGISRFEMSFPLHLMKTRISPHFKSLCVRGLSGKCAAM